MKFSISGLVSGALLLASSVAAYTNPLACSGVCNNAHDPSVIRRSDGTYFRFSTGGGIAIHTAPAISGPWTYKGQMLASGSKISNSGNKDLWAPSVHLVGSTFYVYYSVSTFGTQNSAVGLATSSTMNVGSFTDRGSVGVTSSTGKSYNAIDPALIQIGSDYYLNFGSFWGDLYQVKMKSTPTAASGSSVQIAYQPSGSHAIEGAYQIYYSGYYYLFWSEGQCCGLDASRPASGGEYKIRVCRSKTGTGSFVDSSGKSCTNGGGYTVLASHGTVYAPGGQSLYNDPTNGWIIVYHYVDTTVGYADGQKKFGWNKLKWNNGWPTV